MKTIIKIAATGLLFLGTNAFAAFTIDEIHQAAKLATDAFQVANPDHAPHFNGYKVWPSGDDAKVKIYVNHEGMSMEFNYLCHKHDDALECHAQ